MFAQTTAHQGISPNIAKGLGNDELLSDLTRLLNEDSRGSQTDYKLNGQGFSVQNKYGFNHNRSPAPPPQASYEVVHHQIEKPLYHRPIAKDPILHSKSIKQSFIPHQPHSGNNGNIENSIGGAFYDPHNDLVVSYKVL